MGDVTWDYTYTGDKLTCMTVGDNTLYFAYDVSGVPMSVTYNDVTYYYVTNVQGDVIALVDSSGAEVVSYSYDAWGNLLSTDGELKETLGKDNPLRYRGYVYDTETKLYYLQSRYYNPEIGRFINADAGIASPGKSILGNNLFAYAFNNPVAYSDSTGNWPSLSSVFLGIAVAAVAVAAVAAIVVTCGAAAPVVATVTGVAVSSASAVAAVTAVGLTACNVAIAATAVSAAALAQEKAAKNNGINNHSVYVLKDEEQNVQYVGRTVNIKARAAAHASNPNRAGLKMEVVATGLNLVEARALEQAGMAYHHTLNTCNKMNNQINGVSPKFWAGFKTIAMGTLDYRWNQMTNEILYWAGM